MRADCIQQLLDHLGIERAHIAARMPQDWQGLVENRPEAIASLSLLCPGFLNPHIVSTVAERLLVFSSDLSLFGKRIAKAVAQLPSTRYVTFPNYETRLWADIVREHGDTILDEMIALISASDVAMSSAKYPEAGEVNGEVAGISFRITGSGPPLLLLPLGLAPSGWQPLLPHLRKHFRTILLAGPKLGMMPMLEQRGLSWGYRKMMQNLFEWIALQPGEEILEVGSGTGVVCRWLVEETAGQNPITGVDLNSYLLGESKALVQQHRLQKMIRFQEGNAEALPFEDNAFDVAFSVTVMEEVHAKRMLEELIRVVRPGGRVGAIVRATDTAYKINLPVCDELRRGFEEQQILNEGQSCASATLYRLFQQSGMRDVRFAPQLVPLYNAFGEVEQFLQAGYIAGLSDSDATTWHAALQKADGDGTFFITWPHHAAVGTVSDEA